MTGPRRIVFASPIEPSGASWLVNCFLELGIRVNHRPAESKLWRKGDPSATIWIEKDGRARLSPRAAILGKWMPSLVHRESFRFRDDVVVDYRQDLPLRGEQASDTLLFIRDPRDAIYSMYRRRGPDMTFADFCAFPNPETLLNRPDHWRLHVECWQARAGGRVYRFEEYKADATALLRRILDEIGIGVGEAEIVAAVAASDSAQARAAEAIYRARHPSDTEVANRAGAIGDWKNGPDRSGAQEMIERRAGPLMRSFGYEPETLVADGERPVSAPMTCLPIYDEIDLPGGNADRGADPRGDPDLPGLAAQIAGLTPETIEAARMSPAESRTLLDSMMAFQRAVDGSIGDNLEQVSARLQDGASAHLQTLNDLLRKKRAARRAARSQS